MSLNARQQVFIDSYLSTFNATKAALAAGYSEKTAHSIGSENLKKPEIAQAISERLSATAMGRDEVIMRLADMGRGDINDVLDDDGDLDLAKARRNGKTKLIKKWTRKIKTVPTKDGTIEEVTTSVEMYSALDALDKLGKHHGLFSDKPEEAPTEQSQVVIYLPSNDRN
jgi:phage terminase small subunit